MSQLGAVALTAMLAVSPALGADESFVYFGTDAKGPGAGIAVARFNTATGALTPPEIVVDAPRASFFAIHPDARHLYASHAGSPGALSAYAIDPATGRLTLLNIKSASGADPCYAGLDQTHRFMLDANYSGANIEVHAIGPDGALGDRTGLGQHTGRSIHPRRQKAAYAHSVIADPTNHFLLAADLGADKVFIYRFDERTGAIAPHDPPSVSLAPGSGPRHLRFTPDGKQLYVINELANTITGFDWDGQAGKAREFQTVPTLPTDFKAENTTAEIQIAPGGKFLYGTNRGHDSIVVFSINQSSGALTLVQHISSGGKKPRNFTFDSTGNWLICTNHDSKNAVVFKVDQASGKLIQHGDPVPTPTAYCVRFLPSGK
ncbi:MAG: lactonase family protein [Burkholderiales bacterium]|nr:lactonase family protein [Phycisphaerae bacterium]